MIFNASICCREHGMKRMGNHGGSIGSQHQIQGGSGLMGSGTNLMSESYQQGDRQMILKSLNKL